jgi:hypothetical protein
VAALDFPASPTVGQLFTGQNGYIYQWDGVVWVPSGTTGGVIAGGDLQGTYPNPTIKDRIIPGLKLIKPLFTRVYRNTNLALPNGVTTPIPWTGTTGALPHDPNSPTWVVGSPTRLTIVEPGTYLVGGGLSLGGSATVIHHLIQKTPGGIIAPLTLQSTGYVSMAAMIECAAADYFEYSVLPNAAINTDTQFFVSNMWALRVG